MTTELQTRRDEKQARVRALEREAKVAYAIAKAKDSKREAYIALAKATVELLELTRETQKQVGARIGCSERTVRKLRNWHKSAFADPSPFASRENAKASEDSHTKRVTC